MKDKKFNKLLANFKVLSYKIHCFHTDMKWGTFHEYHKFLWDIYNWLEDQVDIIKERARISDIYTATSLKEIVELSDIEEIDPEDAPITEISVIKDFVSKDLSELEDFLLEEIQFFGKTNDLVTQNILIDFLDNIWKFRWMNDSSL